MEDYISKLPQEAQDVVRLVSRVARQQKTRVYLVGGCVRDMLLGRVNEITDLDFAVEGNGITLAEAVARRLGVPLVRHARFGTASLVSGSMRLDFASTRAESYPHPGHLPVVQASTIEEDLRRRDFSVNAMAIDCASGTAAPALLDPCSGRDDCRRGLIRVLHDASFSDDPTRILRAVRFGQRLRFRIEPHTLRLLRCASEAGVLKRVDHQRLRDELLLMLKEERALWILRRLEALIGMSFLCRGLRFGARAQRFFRAVDGQAAWFERTYAHRRRLDVWILRFIALVDTLSSARTGELVQRLGLRRGERIRILSYKRLARKAGRALSRRSLAGAEVWRILEPLSYETILAIRARFPGARRHIDSFFAVYSDVRVSVTGSDIRALGIVPGPLYRKLLARVLREKLNGRLKTREEELAFIGTFARLQQSP
jgi:tRNA nucleotidyltransferase (CCA-adding enzyme)